MLELSSFTSFTPPPHPLLLPRRYFNSGSAPLECDKEFWDLRDSVVQCELLLLRQLNFYVSFEHPHKVRLMMSLCLPVFVWCLCVGSGYCLVLCSCAQLLHMTAVYKAPNIQGTTIWFLFNSVYTDHQYVYI